MSQSHIVDASILDALTGEARAHPRRRKNLNFHACESAACQRLLNAIEPGSYVPPHRHLDPTKDESIVVVRGRLGVMIFDDGGGVREMGILVPGGKVVLVNVPHGAYHTVIGLEPGTVFFEAKAGPYRPLTPHERAPWAPQEGEPGWQDYLQSLARRLMAG
ncbi:WbuC family cupin fold metalloprotein [Thiobacter aerophilum]|uniref:WbuC family cupin fold metalloprotein n=1 Tax=Thiobacter aerophilum TaxID=3121275 RepID=A0ABV0EH14_9BURK